MSEEKTSQNNGIPPKSPQIPLSSKKKTDTADLKRRFGAVDFVENIADPDEVQETTDVLSLETLREAFSGLFQSEDAEPVEGDPELTENDELMEEVSVSGAFSVTSVDETDVDEESQPEDTESFTSRDDNESVELSPKTILEAMLFVGDRENRPLSAERAAEKMRNVSPAEIDEAVVRLNEDYGKLACPYMIQNEDDGYRMVLRPEFRPVLEKFYGKIREAKLSQQAIDTLAVVAYRQPISAEEVQKIRNQPSSALLSQLVRRGLLEMERESREKKKTVVYRTSERFLELFQLDSIDDLPIAEEIDFR